MASAPTVRARPRGAVERPSHFPSQIFAAVQPPCKPLRREFVTGFGVALLHERGGRFTAKAGGSRPAQRPCWPPRRSRSSPRRRTCSRARWCSSAPSARADGGGAVHPPRPGSPLGIARVSLWTVDDKSRITAVPSSTRSLGMSNNFMEAEWKTPMVYGRVVPKTPNPSQARWASWAGSSSSPSTTSRRWIACAPGLTLHQSNSLAVLNLVVVTAKLLQGGHL